MCVSIRYGTLGVLERSSELARELGILPAFYCRVIYARGYLRWSIMKVRGGAYILEVRL